MSFSLLLLQGITLLFLSKYRTELAVGRRAVYSFKDFDVAMLRDQFVESGRQILTHQEGDEET